MDSTLEDQIDAARAYEALFVPALFGQWVGLLADAVRLDAGQRALDVGCGTGVLAREIAIRVGQPGLVSGLDPNQGMLSVARESAPGIDWKEGEAENIPFPDETFDAVLSQFGLMFFPNRHQSVQEMLRVVKPSGRLAVAVWNSIDEIRGYSAELELVERIAGSPAAAAIRAPFSLGRREIVTALFENAGATRIEVATHKGTARFPSIQIMFEAELRGWLPAMGVHLTEDVIDVILREAEATFSPYVNSGGEVVFDVSAHLVSATKPL